jgi:hypothetical protein
MENTEYNNKTGITLPLSIGDKVTDFKFNYYQDGKFQKGKMSDYEGK